MKKVAFIGAGSYGFTYKLLCDILCKKDLFDLEFAFMDIDSKRLENLKVLVDEHFLTVGYKKDALYTMDFEKALENASFIINLVKIGGYDASVKDMDIPKKYGLYQTVGDTCGVGGISRGLRTMIFNETLLDVAKKVSAPNVMVLNYTNPQQMTVMAASCNSDIPFIGLCHSIQGTTMSMARCVNVPYEEIAFEACGINHLSFITKFERDGKDLYPDFKVAVEKELLTEDNRDHQIFAKFGLTRVDLMRRLGYMVTESPQHLGEYVPYYMRTPELIEKYKIQIDQFKTNIANKTKEHEELISLALEHKLPQAVPSVEYGANIIHSVVTGKPCKIYANVINNGLVENLPAKACVEVPCLVDGLGVHPCIVGKMPTQLAMLCSMEVYTHQLAVEAVQKRDANSVFWAIMADPVANSILTLDEMYEMTKELLEAQKEYLPQFKW